MTSLGRPVRDVAAAAPDPLALPRLMPSHSGPGFDGHFQRWGQMPVGSPRLIAEVERAGLRGRGGAGFPTGAKLRAVSESSARRRVVVANGIEAEPVSGKDRALLTGAPHLVLDGVSVAAETVGASEAVVCVSRAAPAAAQAVARALDERLEAGADRVSIRLAVAPGRYVSGEESALVHWLNGGDAKPTYVPPRPFERGVKGQPTLINNVETLAHLALVARFGAGWFRALGTAEHPGTTLVTLSGDVVRPGVYEFPIGVALSEVLRSAGGSRGTARAVLAGGYAGAWLAPDSVPKARLDPESLRRLGAVMGCAAVSVVGAGSCGLVESASVARWMASQSARQCGPCFRGLPAIARALDTLVAGDRGRRAEKQLRVWLDMVAGRGACHHPDGTVRFVRSTLAVFRDEIERHRRQGPCPSRPALLPVPDSDGGWR